MYATLATLKSYLTIASTAEDTLLTRLLTAATAAINTATGRTFEASDTTRYFTQDDVDGQILYLLDSDLAALTSVTNGDGVAILVANVTTMPRNAAPYFGLMLKSSVSWSWTNADSEIAVVGKWAYSATAPSDIEQACVRLAGYWYRLKDAQVFDVTANPETGALVIPKGLPSDVAQMLEPYRRLT